MIHRSLIPSLFAAAYLISPCLCAAQSLPSEQSVRQLLTDRLSCINAFYIEYHAVVSNSHLELGPRVHRIVAAKHPGYYYHWSGHDVGQRSWLLDEYQQRLTIRDSQCTAERPFNRLCEIYPIGLADPLPGTGGQELLFAATGLWPLNPRPPSILISDASVSLEEVLKSDRYRYSFLPSSNQCLLDWTGHDKIWIDLETGSIIQREIYDPTSNQLLQRIQASQFMKVSDGIVFPRHFVNTLFAPSERPGNEPPIEKQSDLVIDACFFNEKVSDELFTFVPPAGELQVSADGTRRQIEPGGIDYLDSLALLAGRYATPRSSTASALCFAKFVLVGALSSFLILLMARFSTLNKSHGAL